MAGNTGQDMKWQMRCLRLLLRLLGTMRCTLSITLWYAENYHIWKLLGLWGTRSCNIYGIHVWKHVAWTQWGIRIKATSGRQANHMHVESWFSCISVVYRVNKQTNSTKQTMYTHCWQLSHMTSEVTKLHNKQFSLILTITTSNGNNNHRKQSSVYKPCHMILQDSWQVTTHPHNTHPKSVYTAHTKM
jgi:hypothetical protein